MSDDDKKVEVEDHLVDGHDAAYYKQQAEQNDGNFRRVQESLEAVNAEKEALSEKVAETQRQIEEIKAQTQKQTEFKELDPDLVDPKVITNFETLKKQQAEDRAKSEALAKKIAAYETKLRNDEIIAQQDAVRDRVLDFLDEQAGTNKYRSKAWKMAEEATKKDPSLKPTSETAGIKFVGKYYEQLKSEEKKPPTTPEDKGGGGADLKEEPLKKGTFNETLASMRKTFKMGE
jgi:hypothetical protein